MAADDSARLGAEPLPPRSRDEIVLPLRGRPLRNLYVLRLIALDRVIHFVVLAVLGVALVLFAGHQKDLRGDYIRILNSLQSSIGLIASHNGFLREINHFVNLSTTKLYLYGIGFLSYAALNALEAVGLWNERRWAEYLTLIEVTVLVPLEIYELTVSVTVLQDRGPRTQPRRDGLPALGAPALRRARRRPHGPRAVPKRRGMGCARARDAGHEPAAKRRRDGRVRALRGGGAGRRRA